VSGHRGSPRRAPEASPPALNPSRQTRSALSLSAGGRCGGLPAEGVGRDRGSAAGEGFPLPAFQRMLSGQRVSKNNPFACSWLACFVGMAARVLKHAPPKFALAGVSMGGMVALELMRAAPDRVTRLFLCDTNARPDTAEQAANRQNTNAAMLATDDLAALAAPYIDYMIHPKADSRVREALMQMTLRVGAAAYVRQNKAVMAWARFRSCPPLPFQRWLLLARTT
jgi:pimeloyl-ACP methyl ester carboxylesterase